MALDTILVTGGSGFVGPYLLAALEKENARLVATGHPSESPALSPLPPAVHPEWRGLDLRDREAVDALVADVRPTQVYHLAALSSVAQSFEDPEPTFLVNVMGTLHLLEALRRHAPAARVLLISSAEVYGGLSSPLTESCPLSPPNPYAASKAAAEMLGIEYWRAHKLGVLRSRSFNHTGPGQAPHFVASSFARQIALIEAGRQEPLIRVGNLAARRDFLDVRDVVSAYQALMHHGEPGEAYNVCSGRAVAIQEILDGLLALAKVAITIEVDAERLRPIDVLESIGSPEALKASTGWEPSVPLAQTLQDLLNYWRFQLPWLGEPASNLA